MMGRIDRSVVGIAIVAVSVVLHGCAKKHSPSDSTETGNPPVIDAERVALVVQGDDVLVVGKKGAVKPGGVTIAVTNLASDKSASGRAAGDGSFEIKAPGSAMNAYRVQAGSGEDADQVFVLPGVTVRGAAKNGSLSCDQQDELAREQTDNAVRIADTTCTQDDDCTFVSTVTACRSACTEPVVSNTGAMLVGAVVESIDHGLCGDFEKQGCMPTVFHCPNMPFSVPACVNGRCSMKDPNDAGTVDAGGDGGDASTCGDGWNMAMAQLQQAVSAADRSCTDTTDCGYAPSSTDCFGGCDRDVVSNTGLAQVQTALDAINAGTCAAYLADGCPVGGPMCQTPPAAVCKNGRCQPDLSCDEQSNLASSELQVVIGNADKHCSTNADCVLAPVSTDCFQGCSLGTVSLTGEAQVQDAVQRINTGVCADFVADGCSLVLPPCVPPPMPLCVQGQCSTVVL